MRDKTTLKKFSGTQTINILMSKMNLSIMAFVSIMMLNKFNFLFKIFQSLVKMTKFAQNHKNPRKRKAGTENGKAKAHTVEVVQKKTKPTISEAKSLVVEQLTSTDSNIVLSALGCLASSDEGKVEEFFAGGGNANHILHYIDSAEEKVKANDVAAVFNAIEAIISHVVRYVIFSKDIEWM